MRVAIPAVLALVFASASCTPPQTHDPAVRDEASAGVNGQAAAEGAPAPEPEHPSRRDRRRAENASSAQSSPESSAYQYIDETGHVRIAASLEQVPERQRSTATALTSAPPTPPRRRPGTESDEPVHEVQRADVTIYTTPGCGWCRRAIAYFEQKGVDYTSRDISADREAYEDYLGVTGGQQQGVPVIVVGDQWMQGWSQTQFDSLLAAAN